MFIDFSIEKIGEDPVPHHTLNAEQGCQGTTF